MAPSPRHCVQVLSSGVSPAMVAADGCCCRGPRPLVRKGAGPVECSPSQGLARIPGIVWDVCGYYRRLGVSPGASAAELRLAYLERDPVQEDVSLHYALTQLLDPLVRRAYDAQGLGELFLGDRDVCVAIERRAALEASRRSAAAARLGRHAVSLAEVLAGLGLEKLPDRQEARARLAPDLPWAPEGAWELSWGYYRQGNGEMPDPAILETWQLMLCRELSALGVTAPFAVGVCSGAPWRVVREHSNECCIILAGSEQITGFMARMAAVMVQSHNSRDQGKEDTHAHVHARIRRGGQAR